MDKDFKDQKILLGISNVTFSKSYNFPMLAKTVKQIPYHPIHIGLP